MPELTPKERLQPSLLDRLTDDERNTAVESREKRVLSLSQLRQSVLRDLAWLLNTEHLSTSMSFEDCPIAEKSVVNFGVPPLTGSTATGLDIRTLKQRITEVIKTYEPRLLPDSVKVEVRVSERAMSSNALKFEVEADLWAQPLPLHLYLLTEFDLETGQVDIQPIQE